MLSVPGPLVTLESPWQVLVILPEFIPAKWWQHLLHNQTALLIKGALPFRRDKVAISIPYHLDQ